MRGCTLLASVVVFCPGSENVASAVHAYGHAYSRPNDFSSDDYAAITSLFPVFTVEKDHAAAVYGNASAPKPFSTNSYAATVGTARKIKALNASTKVLMYWNAALHYNFYECEASVQPEWLLPRTGSVLSAPSARKGLEMDTHVEKPGVPEYNYSQPEFRAWWVDCAAESVANSSGLLDGLFLDATPKVAKQSEEIMGFWDEMVDQLRQRLGASAIILDNGFFITPGDEVLAGLEAWSHSNASYVESLVATGHSPQEQEKILTYLSNATAAHPEKMLVGHGGMATTMQFEYGLANYLLVSSSASDGYFLANSGYSIDGGLLVQPNFSHYYTDNVGCGNPTAPYFERGEHSNSTFTRQFQFGTVSVDVTTRTATFDCSGGN